MRINLLPSRVAGRGGAGAAWAIVLVLLGLELVGLAIWQKGLLDTEQRMQADVTKAEADANAVNQLATDAQNERAKIAPIQAKVQFVKDLQKYNVQRPDLYQTTAEYTLKDIAYNQMSASDNFLQVSAWAPSLSDAGRYLLAMQNDPDFSAVRISGVPGYPPGGAAGGGGGPGENSGGAPGGAFNSGGGPPGVMNSGGGFNSGGGAPGPTMNSGGGFNEAGPGGPTGLGPGGPGGPSFGGGGSGGGRSLTGGAFQSTGYKSPPRPSQGFRFTVTAQLVNPIRRPLPGGQQQQPGFGGGFGEGGVPAGAMNSGGGFAPQEPGGGPVPGAIGRRGARGGAMQE